MLTLVPVSLKEANAFVSAHHRHHRPVTGHKFSIGCEQNGRLVGVATHQLVQSTVYKRKPLSLYILHIH